VIRGLAALLLMGSLLHPARITFWLNDSGEYDFVVKAHLGGDHDRICGIVSPDEKLWDSMTFQSGGAHVGISKTGLPLDAAKLAVEQDCR
jgi:hypothetical protein